MNDFNYMLPTPTGWNIDLSQVSKGIVIMSILSAFKHEVKVSTETYRYDSMHMFPGLVSNCHHSVLHIKEVH